LKKADLSSRSWTKAEGLTESLNQLRESPDYELCQFSERKPGVLEELAAERAKLLEREAAELEKQAGLLAEEISELSGEASRIG
jgi:hypothetical protein